MSSIISLNDRHTDATQKLILSTAVELLERSGVADLTVRAVARAAGMSERTIFRYFPSRDEFLDAVAAEATRRMHAPAPPGSIKELLDYPAHLYTRFEENAPLVAAVLHTEIFSRVRETVAQERWQAVTELVKKNAKGLSKKERKTAATNISYFLSATTWNYYRSRFGLSLEETIDCAKSAIRLVVAEFEQK